MAFFRDHPWLARLALGSLASLLALAMSEALLRFLRPQDTRPLEEQLKDSERSRPSADEDVSMRGLVRASSNPRLIYELKPSLEGQFHHAPISINEFGYRGAPRPRAKPPGTFRILGLGDSVAFGWGVRQEQTYLAQLEDLLNARGGQRYEALDFGVPGYNSMQEAEQLESIGLAWAPDAAILCVVDNDVGLPNFIQKQDGSLLQRFQLFRQISMGAYQGDIVSDGDRRLPPEYVSMVGAEAVEQAIGRIGYLARRHQFTGLVFAFNGKPAWLENIRKWSQAAGLQFLDLAQWRRTHGLNDEKILRLSAKDMHPNPRYHHEIALFLESGWPRSD